MNLSLCHLRLWTVLHFAQSSHVWELRSVTVLSCALSELAPSTFLMSDADHVNKIFSQHQNVSKVSQLSISMILKAENSYISLRGKSKSIAWQPLVGSALLEFGLNQKNTISQILSDSPFWLRCKYLQEILWCNFQVFQNTFTLPIHNVDWWIAPQVFTKLSKYCWPCWSGTWSSIPFWTKYRRMIPVWS